MTFTGFIGKACMFPLRAIIAACVALQIHPNVLTFVGVLINSWAAWQLAQGRFISAGFIMIVANIFDFIDGKVAHITGTMSKFGGFWDSVIDRFSDIALFIGLIYLYSSHGRTDYVMVASFAMMFALMTSYTRARAESLIAKCKVGFMERPERIVLFMIGAFTNRMAAVTLGDPGAVDFLGRRSRHPDLSGPGGAAGTPNLDSGRTAPDPDGMERVLLDVRSRDLAVRRDGDRDPRLRVAHPAGLAWRPRGAWTGAAWVARWILTARASIPNSTTPNAQSTPNSQNS